MIGITIVCVGRLKEKYWTDACNEYSKRLKSYCNFRIVEVDEERLPDSPSEAQINATLEKEGKRILAAVPNGAKIYAMCIEGRQKDSRDLARGIEELALSGVSQIAFVIGGSWGLSDEVKNSAAFKLSMSPMTFPHQLARVMLCEQIYRSFQINSGGKYHK